MVQLPQQLISVSDFHTENPLLRSPTTLLIDDPTPGINPLYYFAEQVPHNAIDYHYRSKNGEWFFSTDEDCRFPISKNIDANFVHEFASWVATTQVKGKISIIPFPAGLGRVDRGVLKGIPEDQVRDFLKVVRTKVMPKFDVSSELLTHTNALDLKTMKLKKGISEHDWSQKQNSRTLAPYIALSLRILKNAGIDVSGVTSPCNFGTEVEGEYVRAILEASKEVLKSPIVWYFLHVDKDSLSVAPRVMHLDRTSGEAVVSIVASSGDPFWTSQTTSRAKGEWIDEILEPLISKDGRLGRVPELVSNGSPVTLVTHWQSLYSNGSRYGLNGLRDLVSRINSHLGKRIVWLNCREIANYSACATSCNFRTLYSGNSTVVELLTPFACSDFTFSFVCNTVPKSIGEKKGKKVGRLSRARGAESLTRNSWAITREGRIVVCLRRLAPGRGPNAASCSIILN